MALNIPMPGNFGESFSRGINTGSTMFSRIMQPILERERQKQLENHFKQQMELQKAQFARSGANADLTRQILQQQLLGLKNKNDPNYEINQYKALENLITGGQQAAPTQDMPTQEVGQGMGVFSPQGLAEAQQGAPSSNQGGIDLNLLRQHPMLRGFAKKHFGFDPLGKEFDRPYQGAARNAVDLERLKKEQGEDSEVYQNAKAEYDANIQSKKDLSLIRERSIGGLKPGERWLKDDTTGERIGIQHTLTEKERSEEEGRSFFNELYPIVYQGAAPFSGEGSIRRLEEAAANYKTDPKARKMFDDFLLAEKALTASVVKEAATLNAGKTNQTYKQLRESLIADDVPKKIKSLIKQYQIPASANLKAALAFQKLLNEATNKSRKMVPATRDLYFSPELQNKKSQQQESSSTKSVIVINPEGKRFETTEENAAHLPEGWKRG